MLFSTPSHTETKRPKAVRVNRAKLFGAAAQLAWMMAFGHAAMANPPPGAPLQAVATSNDNTSAAPAQLPGSKMQGQATLSFWGLRIYRARLWTMPPFQPDKLGPQPLLLELDYLRDLKGQDIAERSLKEMRLASPMSEAQAQKWLAQMQRIFPNVKAGDRISGLHQPDQGASFWYNGQPAGQVLDAEFSRLFFGIWLAPTTSEPQMRMALLGLREPLR